MPTFFANKRNKCLLKQASSADYRICIYKVGGKVASRNAENRILILYAFADSCICIRFVQQRSELDRLFTCLYLEHHRYLLFVTELETERTGLAATRYNYTSVQFQTGVLGIELSVSVSSVEGHSKFRQNPYIHIAYDCLPSY